METFNEYLSEKGIEGESKNKFHYTQNIAGGSGITIGRGLDLAKNNEWDLKKLGISETVINKLKDYIGLIGDDAKKHHGAKSPLTRDEYIHVIEKTVNSNLETIEKKFNNDSKIGSFKSLPKRLQYMIGSVYFQMGTSDPAKTAPGFWNQVTTGNWGALEKNMKDFGMKQTVEDKKTGKFKEVEFDAGNNRRRLEWKMLEDSGWSVEKLNQNYKPKIKDEASLIQNWKIEDNPFNLA